MTTPFPAGGDDVPRPRRSKPVRAGEHDETLTHGALPPPDDQFSVVGDGDDDLPVTLRTRTVPLWLAVVLGAGLLTGGTLFGGIVTYVATRPKPGPVAHGGVRMDAGGGAGAAGGVTDLVLDVDDPRTITPYLRSFKHTLSGDAVRDPGVWRQLEAHHAPVTNVQVNWTLVVKGVGAGGAVGFEPARWPYPTEVEWRAASDDDRPMLELSFSVEARRSVANQSGYSEAVMGGKDPSKGGSRIAYTSFTPSREEAATLSPGDRYAVRGTLIAVTSPTSYGEVVRTRNGTKQQHQYRAILDRDAFSRAR